MLGHCRTCQPEGALRAEAALALTWTHPRGALALTRTHARESSSTQVITSACPKGQLVVGEIVQALPIAEWSILTSKQLGLVRCLTAWSHVDGLVVLRRSVHLCQEPLATAEQRSRPGNGVVVGSCRFRFVHNTDAQGSRHTLSMRLNARGSHHHTLQARHNEGERTKSTGLESWRETRFHKFPAGSSLATLELVPPALACTMASCVCERCLRSSSFSLVSSTV